MQEAIQQLSKTLSLRESQVKNVLKLQSEGDTIPFIARYRKEMTGSLDEVAIQSIIDGKAQLDKLEDRRAKILASIEEQGKLSDDLREKIASATDINTLEDLYLPYKSKRKTRADKARDLGLEGLAKIIMSQADNDLKSRVKQFVKGEVKSDEDALQGARDIIAEWINENEWTRQQVRREFGFTATIQSKLIKSKKEEAVKYENYFDWSEALKKCPSHRYLAMTRGEKEGFLRVSVSIDEDNILEKLKGRWVKSYNHCSQEVEAALKDAYKRLIAPSVENEFRSAQKEKADSDAIKVFATNLKQLLLQPPVGEKRTLAIDPGFRTGCKVVCLDETGKLLHNETIYPHPPQKEWSQAIKKLAQLVQIYNVEVIAIGNGTAGRETENLVKKVGFDRKVLVYVVDESGASIYSASSVGREEFPQHDVTVRGAVSIGRRLMDPLAELVKIDPKSIGVGQYQHDVDQGMLKQSLERVVESVVNSVGVNLNTASKYLLQNVSGVGPSLAESIVAYRDENGKISSRAELKKVPKLGPKAFEQCAAFLRIDDAKNPLDNSAVHPESYKVVDAICKQQKLELKALINNDEVLDGLNLEQFVTESIGLPTLKDIVAELKKPGRDPRQYLGVLEFDKSIQGIADLKPGMELPGLISNVTNFGAFVDIGIKENGLVHISQLRDEYVSNPADVVSVYDKVRVKVMSVDMDKKRIQLSMKGLN